ncbi:MAG: 50S ribosomal protein L17 [Proteobacteria bacterium]|nr:50S ribosomal protein L17 [Pseudomonadota bacterium]
MRHRIKGRKLGRTTSHRQAMLANIAVSLITHEQIETTLSKAKELRPYVEKLITLGKKGGLSNRRIAIAQLANQAEPAAKLFTTLAERYKTRAGGYTRIIKTGYRVGDNADVAVIEFVDRDVTAKGKKDIADAKARQAAQEAEAVA